MEVAALDTPEAAGAYGADSQGVIGPLGLTPELVQVPPGSAPDLDTASVNFEEAIAAAGGVDLQILGIGTDGHLGFNEPTSSFASRTRIKTLTPRTRRDNARFFSSIEEVPTHCLTQGLATIPDARELLLVALGEAKAAAVAAAVEGPVAAICPASALQLHRFASVVLDRDAASQLRFGEYYEYVFANKPS